MEALLDMQKHNLWIKMLHETDDANIVQGAATTSNPSPDVESLCTIVDLDPIGRASFSQWYEVREIKRCLQKGDTHFTSLFLSQAPLLSQALFLPAKRSEPPT